MRLTLLLLAAALLAPLSQAQFVGPPPATATPQPAPTLVPAPPPAGAESMILLPGDLCEVQIFDVPYDFKGRVSDAGDLALPLAGTAHVLNLSVVAAEQLIAAKLQTAELIRDPQVSLHVLESPNHFAAVTGEVKSPGQIPIYGEKHLLDVLAAAGGLTPAGSPLVTIFRRGMADPFQVQIPANPGLSGRFNIVILPGDNIVVAKVGVVYVFGAVHQQGAVPMKGTSPLTLIEAMTLAGGVNFEASRSKAYILRVSADGRQEIPFDAEAVLKHQAPDQSLQSDDIVLIPTSAMKAALKGGVASLGATLLAGYLAVR